MPDIVHSLWYSDPIVPSYYIWVPYCKTGHNFGKNKTSLPTLKVQVKLGRIYVAISSPYPTTLKKEHYFTKKGALAFPAETPFITSLYILDFLHTWPALQLAWGPANGQMLVAVSSSASPFKCPLAEAFSP